MVKELIENSIDANSTEIEINFSKGGKQVSIIDNGDGIEKEDISTIFQKHATSKIEKTDDLWNIHTLGFRGEALSSIASVSEITLTSCTSNSKEAFKINNHFGNIKNITSLSSPKGTSFYINKLFDNVPARKKFLKSDSAEEYHIKNVIKALALANLHITFRIKTNNKLLYYWPKTTNYLNRSQQIFEEEHLYSINKSINDSKINIVFAPPNITFKNSKNIWLLIQNRWIQDKTLQSAILESYRSLLMHNEYPLCCLWLQVNPQEIDVNIHPTKSQIKWLNASKFFKITFHTLKEALNQSPWTKDFLPNIENNPNIENIENIEKDSNNNIGTDINTSTDINTGTDINTSTDNTTMSTNATTLPIKNYYNHNKKYNNNNNNNNNKSKITFENLKNIYKNEQYEQLDAFGQNTNYQDTNHINNHFNNHVNNYTSNHSINSTNNNTINTINNINNNTSNDAINNDINNNNLESFKWSYLKIIGQVKNTYLITQSKEKLIIIDQHAAHERIVYEKLKKSWKDKIKLNIQNLLIPLHIDLNDLEVEALIKEKQNLSQIGINIEQSGPQSITINSLPQIVKENALITSLKSLANEIIEKNNNFNIEKTVEKTLAQMACHSAIRAGEKLKNDQIQDLLNQMDNFPLSSFCPHGRPVFIEYDFYEIEKKFKRIV